MLNYLVNCSQPDLAYSVHQCARLYIEPRQSHEQAVKKIIRYLLYLKRINQLGVNYVPDESKSLEVFVDVSFAGEWNKHWSDEPTSVMSRTGYVIKYANCPIICFSKLQTEIALSKTESKYIAFSQAMRDAIRMIGLLEELQKVMPYSQSTPTLHCKSYEDNRRCIDLINSPRLWPRTKHIVLKYHHFREHVKSKTISVEYIETGDQIADIFTKALAAPQFLKLRSLLTGHESPG